GGVVDVDREGVGRLHVVRVVGGVEADGGHALVGDREGDGRSGTGGQRDVLGAEGGIRDVLQAGAARLVAGGNGHGDRPLGPAIVRRQGGEGGDRRADRARGVPASPERDGARHP